MRRYMNIDPNIFGIKASADQCCKRMLAIAGFFGFPHLSMLPTRA
jgi:hypothetical protein